MGVYVMCLFLFGLVNYILYFLGTTFSPDVYHLHLFDVPNWDIDILFLSDDLIYN